MRREKERLDFFAAIVIVRGLYHDSADICRRAVGN
jgi:hypothetical protein